MPEPYLYAAGFNIVKNLQIGHFTIVDYSVTETSLVRYHSYKYDVSIIFKNNGGNIDELAKFNHMEKTINSSHDNPYFCTLDYKNFEKIGNDMFKFHYEGYAKRI